MQINMSGIALIKLNKTEMHEAFNDGAKHFLNLLIKQ